MIMDMSDPSDTGSGNKPPSKRQIKEHTQRLRAFTHQLFELVATSVDVDVDDLSARLRPQPGAAPASWWVLPEGGELIVAVGVRATRWELDITDVLDVELTEQLLLAAVAGKVVEIDSPGRVSVEVDLGRHGVQRTELITGVRGLLPWPGREHRAKARAFAAYELREGAVLRQDPRGPTEEDRQPPRLVLRLRAELDEMVSGTDDTVAHEFKAAGVLGLPTDRGDIVHGWSSTITYGTNRQRLWLWYDALDEEVDALIDDTYWFEWRDLTDEAVVASEVSGFVQAVLQGRVRRWQVGRRKGCDVVLADGRTVSTTPGRN